jgi:hypothetical protein
MMNWSHTKTDLLTAVSTEMTIQIPLSSPVSAKAAIKGQKTDTGVKTSQFLTFQVSTPLIAESDLVRVVWKTDLFAGHLMDFRHNTKKTKLAINLIWVKITRNG